MLEESLIVGGEPNDPVVTKASIPSMMMMMVVVMVLSSSLPPPLTGQANTLGFILEGDSAEMGDSCITAIKQC